MTAFPSRFDQRYNKEPLKNKTDDRRITISGIEPTSTSTTSILVTLFLLGFIYRMIDKVTHRGENWIIWSRWFRCSFPMLNGLVIVLIIIKGNFVSNFLGVSFLSIWVFLRIVTSQPFLPFLHTTDKRRHRERQILTNSSK